MCQLCGANSFDYLTELRWPTLPEDISETRSACSKPPSSRKDSQQPGSCPVCPPVRNTAESHQQNACPSSGNPCHPQPTPLQDLAAARKATPCPAPDPITLHHPRARLPPDDVETDACGEHCRAQASLPSAQRSSVLPVKAIRCN